MLQQLLPVLQSILGHWIADSCIVTVLYWLLVFVSVELLHFNSTLTPSCLQCFDAEGWASGRASGL